MMSVSKPRDDLYYLGVDVFHEQDPLRPLSKIPLINADLLWLGVGQEHCSRRSGVFTQSIHKRDSGRSLLICSSKAKGICRHINWQSIATDLLIKGKSRIDFSTTFIQIRPTPHVADGSILGGITEIEVKLLIRGLVTEEKEADVGLVQEWAVETIGWLGQPC
jgi:hypothetical protein